MQTEITNGRQPAAVCINTVDQLRRIRENFRCARNTSGARSRSYSPLASQREERVCGVDRAAKEWLYCRSKCRFSFALLTRGSVVDNRDLTSFEKIARDEYEYAWDPYSFTYVSKESWTLSDWTPVTEYYIKKQHWTRIHFFIISAEILVKYHRSWSIRELKRNRRLNYTV